MPDDSELQIYDSKMNSGLRYETFKLCMKLATYTKLNYEITEDERKEIIKVWLSDQPGRVTPRVRNDGSAAAQMSYIAADVIAVRLDTVFRLMERVC